MSEKSTSNTHRELYHVQQWIPHMYMYMLRGSYVCVAVLLMPLVANSAFAAQRGPLPPPAMLPVALQRRWRATFGCGSCDDTRAVSCPNCDGRGGYTAMGGIDVACKACRGTGRVICRDCFTGDGYDIDKIRRFMNVPD